MAKKKECNVEGCSERQHALGVCKTHLDQGYVLACSEKLEDGSDCDRDVFSKGRCKTHYMRKYRKKQGQASPAAGAPIRGYGQERFEVFTRIERRDAEVILRAAGRKDGMYEQAAKILTAWARRREKAEESAS